MTITDITTTKTRGGPHMNPETLEDALTSGFDPRSQSTLYAGRTEIAKANFNKAKAAQHVDPAMVTERICIAEDCTVRLVRKSAWDSLTPVQKERWILAGLGCYTGRGRCSYHFNKAAKVVYLPVDLDYAINLARANNVMPRKPLRYEEGTPAPKWGDVSWMESSSCSQTDPDVFSPTREKQSDPAKKICFNCRVRDECLLAAIRNREEHGVWGGYTGTELNQIYDILDPAVTDIFIDVSNDFDDFVVPTFKPVSIANRPNGEAAA